MVGDTVTLILVTDLGDKLNSFLVIRGRFGLKCADLDHFGDYEKFKEKNDQIHEINNLIKSINSDRITVMDGLSTDELP